MILKALRRPTLTLLALALLSAAVPVSCAEDGPVQIYIRKDADTVQTQKNSPSDYAEYRAELGQPETRKPIGDTKPFQAADGYMLLNFTEGQTRWLYGF